MADDHIVFGGVFFEALQQADGMLRTVNGGAQQLGHPGVELNKVIAAFAGGDDVLHFGEQGTGVGHEERAGLDLQTDCAPGLCGELFELFLDRLAYDLEVGRLLLRHAPDLKTTPKVERDNVRELADDIEIHFSNLKPDLGIAARADMRMDTYGSECILCE